MIAVPLLSLAVNICSILKFASARPAQYAAGPLDDLDPSNGFPRRYLPIRTPVMYVCLVHFKIVSYVWYSLCIALLIIQPILHCHSSQTHTRVLRRLPRPMPTYRPRAMSSLRLSSQTSTVAGRIPTTGKSQGGVLSVIYHSATSSSP